MFPDICAEGLTPFLGKYLLALKCLLAAQKLSPEDPVVHEQIIKFQLFRMCLAPPASDKVCHLTCI